MINATNNNPILTDRNKIAENNLFEALTHQKDKKKPETPKGYLLERNNIAKNVVQDVAYFGKDIKNTGKAIITGKSNDHALGKINDLGLKIGALAIASYLALKRGTAKKKAMEFIGGGAFLTTMAVWPKLTVAKPMEKKFGFNIQQDYVDSQGRRKKFFGDNQYLPWDLWSKEKINKVADHMGIPKDLPDREEFTKRKMQKVALQGNTWILLTSGFATPLITALVCRAAENPVEKFLVNRNIKKAANKVVNMDSSVDKMVANKLFDSFNKQDFLNALKGFKDRDIDSEVLTELTKYLDPIEELSKDKNISAHVVKAELNGARNRLANNLYNSFDTDTLYNNQILTKMKELLSPERFEELKKCVEEFKGRNKTAVNFKATDLLKEQGFDSDKAGKILNEIRNTQDHDSMFKELRKSLRMDEASKGIKTIYDIQREKRAQVRILANFADAIAGNHKESLYTQVGEEFNKEFIRQINPDYEAIKEFVTKSDYSNMLHESFEKLATNVGSQRHKGIGNKVEGTRGTLEYFVKNISTSLKKLDTEYDKYFEMNGAESLDKFLKNVAEPDDNVTKCFDEVTKKYIDRVTKHVRLSKLFKQCEGAELIIAADTERRLSLLKDMDALKKAFTVDAEEFKAITNQDVYEILDAIKEYLYNRPSNAKYVKNKHSEIISKKAIKFIFEDAMDEKVATELAENGTKEIVDKVRGLYGVNWRMDPDMARSFLIGIGIEKGKTDDGWFTMTDEIKDMGVANMVEKVKNAFGDDMGQAKYHFDEAQGDSLVNRFRTIVKDNEISKKWLKTFGIAAIALTAVTVGAIKFFGKTDKEQELYAKKGVKNAKN